MPRQSQVERERFTAMLMNKPKLVDIEVHHVDKGETHMSMTRIVELLIDKEHKRLKL